MESTMDNPGNETPASLLKFREKRKWQIALRRYVLEKAQSAEYAPYFGIDIEGFRKWIELQFTEGVNWENFGSSWQLDHIVPVAYFDFGIREDLLVCWNFINIRVERLELNKARGNRVDVLVVKKYFEDLLEKTNYSICHKMVEKINQIEVSNICCFPELEDFIIERKKDLEAITDLSIDDLRTINKGSTLKDVLLQKEILKKFG
jgi:hypothetical protein